MADDHERPGFTGGGEQGAQVRRRVGQGVSRARVAPSPAGPVVGTGPGGRRELVVDGAPSAAVAARPRLQYDGRRTAPATIEIERSRSDIDPLALGGIGCGHPVTGEPPAGTARAGDIDGQRDDESGRDRGRDGDDEPAAASCRDGVHRPVAYARNPLYPPTMCRSIKTLRRADEAATTGELEAAARQYVRKISGYRTPSARNAAAFEAAIARDRPRLGPAARSDRRGRRGRAGPLDPGRHPRRGAQPAIGDIRLIRARSSATLAPCA